MIKIFKEMKAGWDKGAEVTDRMAERLMEADLDGWPAEIGRGYGPIPADAIRPDTLGIFDKLLWQSHGIAGGPEALFDKINSEMSAETRAWLRRNAHLARHSARPNSDSEDGNGDKDNNG